MTFASRLTFAACSVLALAASGAHAQQAPAVDVVKADARAAATVKQMTADEKVILTNGIMPLPFFPGTVIPEGAIYGAGYIPGILG